jgi:p-hydroxybenzoate 3-monooxygenase
VVKDLTNAWLDGRGELYFEANATKIEDIESDNPKIYFEHGGEESVLECDFVAACDGFHGLGRKTMPKDSYNEFTVTYPFSWLGILANVAPSSEELIYAYHENGFALSSSRSESVSRLYIQCKNDDKVENWTDDQIWDELEIRLGTPGWELKRGPIFEKGITPMRSYFIDNMQKGRLFLAGDAAHIVPPTGGKGLNLAIADVKHLVDGFTAFYKDGNTTELDSYSEKNLACPRFL